MLQGGHCVLYKSFLASCFLFSFFLKMVINQSYLFVLLLASLSASCTSDCPTSEPYGQPAYDECTKLYTKFETALLNNSVNLFKLRDILFPRSSLEPTYVMATFHSKGAECYRYWYNHKECYYTCWTSSLLLRSVAPSVVTVIQLQLLNRLLQTVGASELTDSSHAQLDLELKVNFTENNQNIINEMLQDLTAWVSSNHPNGYKEILECFENTCRRGLASSPGHSQILSCSRGEKSGEGLVLILRHGPEMMNLVSM